MRSAAFCSRADVNYKVTREFLQHVQERALGEQVVRAVSPGQQIVKIVHDELANLLGEGKPTLHWARLVPTVFMVVGLQGSGKTTTVAKIAKRLAKEGREPLLAACDLYRPAAVDQLVALGEQIGVPVYRGESGADPVEVAKAAVEVARRDHRSVLIVDTAGRLQIDEPMMDELRRLKGALEPQEILLVADAMTGQEAVKIAEGFDKALGLTGVILTKMDGDARGERRSPFVAWSGSPSSSWAWGRRSTIWNWPIRSGWPGGFSRWATWWVWWKGPSRPWTPRPRRSSRSRCSGVASRSRTS